MSFAMTKAEREAFLADVHVGIVCVNEAGRGPLAAPVWYRYEAGGDVCFVTGGQSRKAKALRAAGRATMVAQTEAAPYKYVTVEGPVTFGEPDIERDARQVAIRYLGKVLGEQYVESTANTRESSVLVRITPERWLTVDYTKQFAG